MRYVYLFLPALIAFTLLPTSLSGQSPTKELIMYLPDESETTIENGIKISTHLPIYKLSYPSIVKAMEAKASIERQKGGEAYIMYNHKIQFRDSIPNDLLYANQQYFNGKVEESPSVAAEEAWAFARGGISAEGDTIVVAVVDDGIDLTHSDLQGNLWVNWAEVPNNGIDDDMNGYIDDVRGWNVQREDDSIPAFSHGTRVAGLIGAQGNNGIFIAGANWNIKILPVSLDTSARIDDVIKAYEYVLSQRERYNATNGAQGAYIVAMNNSFGLEGFTEESAPFWCEFFNQLGSEGVLTVSSVTNSPIDIDEVGDLPTVCSSPFLVTVGALSRTNKWLSSGFSPEHVDIAAPGQGLLTLESGGTQATISGTSGAASLVCGLAALLYSTSCPDLTTLSTQDPSEAVRQVKDIIMTEGRSHLFLHTKTVSGKMVDYGASVKAISRSCDTCNAPNQIVSTFQNDTLLISIPNQLDSLLWLIRMQPDQAWDTLYHVPGDSLYLPNGPGCNNAQISFIQVCDSVPGFQGEIFSLADYTDCKQCELPYCLPRFGKNNSYWLDSINFNSQKLYAGISKGYVDYTTRHPITLSTAEENTLYLDVQASQPNEGYNVVVWMDTDHSGLFDPNEVIGRTTFQPANQVNIALDIPFTSVGGLTKVRIGLAPFQEDISPCGSFDSTGIYKDFCISLLVEDPECEEIDSIRVIRKTENQISINSFPRIDDDESVNVRYRKENSSNWEEISSGSGTLILDQLEGPCTTYELEIRRVCEFDTSVFSETFMVETACPNSTLSGLNQALQIYPNPASTSFQLQGVKTEGPAKARLQIFSITGSLLRESEIIIHNHQSSLIKVGDLQDGIYLIQLQTASQTYSGKLILSGK